MHTHINSCLKNKVFIYIYRDFVRNTEYSMEFDTKIPNSKCQFITHTCLLNFNHY